MAKDDIPMRRAGLGTALAVALLGALAAAVALFIIILISSDESPPGWLYGIFWAGVLVAVAGFAWALGLVIGRYWPRR